jgi:ferredoxin
MSQIVASVIGAPTIREYVIGLEDKPPTPAQLDQMRELVRREMEAGALGITTALIYPPAFFAKTEELIESGYRATANTLDQLGTQLSGVARGMYPTRRLRVLVDEERCVGCGSGVVQAPQVFRLDQRGKAEVLTPVQSWSPIDGAYVLNCPTYAISVRPEDSAA